MRSGDIRGVYVYHIERERAHKMGPGRKRLSKRDRAEF
jgi:hypothetical protein